jgi:hypothetical protein
MSHKQEGLDLNDSYQEELGENDYGFVVGADGELKSVFVPTTDPVGTIPANVLEILKMFGIHEMGGQRTLH